MLVLLEKVTEGHFFVTIRHCEQNNIGKKIVKAFVWDL